MKSFINYTSFALIFLFVSGFNPLAAQNSKDIEQQELVWGGYFLTAELNAAWALNLSAQNRMYTEELRQHQFISTAKLTRDIGAGWKVSPGFIFFIQTFPQDPDAAFEEHRLELRPIIEFQQTQKISPAFSISHRYRPEFRFFETEPESGTFEYGNIRFRYKLQANWKLNDRFTLKAFDEIHISIGDEIVNNVFNQNRIGGSVETALFYGLSIEFGYLNWFQQRSTGSDFFNRHIGTVTIRHKLKFKQNRVFDN